MYVPHLTRILFLSTLLIGVSVFFLPQSAFAAGFQFSPASGSHASGAEFSVKVQLNPSGTSVNVGDGTITFDKTLLTVSSISKDGSVFSLWTTEPKFSNTDGTITFSGGSPSSFSSTGTVFTVKFKGKSTGSAKVGFTAGSILAADGKGTNVYSPGGDATYTITEAKSSASEESSVGPSELDELTTGVTPIAPTINSSTFSKSDMWYSTSTAEFSWIAPPDVTGIRYLFSTKEDGVPIEKLEASKISHRIDDVADGVWYFYLQFRNEAGWGEVGKKKIQKDSVQPAEFEVTLLSDGEHADVPKLSFQTTDDLSGMERYEVIIGGKTTGTVKEKDLVGGLYPVPVQEGGPQKVTIKAYDKASNMREASKDLTLPAVAKASSKKADAEALPPASPWTSERIVLILFAFAIGALVAWNLNMKKTADKERVLILHDVLALREKNDKIFGAIREEFEEMVNDFDEKPQLTPHERDFLEKIKEVLDISEELVDSGIEDLKKTVRGK